MASIPLIRVGMCVVRERRSHDEERDDPDAAEHDGFQPPRVEHERHVMRRRSGDGMRANISLVNETISEIIQCPEMNSAMPTAASFGTKASVTSWICVIDCRRDTPKPTTRAVMRIGAASFAATSRLLQRDVEHRVRVHQPAPDNW